MRQLTRQNSSLTPMLMLIIYIKIPTHIKCLTARHMLSDQLHLRSLEILPSIKNPRQGRDNQHDGESHDAVIHRAPSHWDRRREDEKHRRDNRVRNPKQIARPAQRLTQFERPVSGQLGAEAEAVDGWRDSIGDAKGDDRGGEDGVEGDGGAEENEAVDNHEDGGEDEGVEGHFEGGDNFGKEAGEGKAAVTGKGVGHAAGGCHNADAGCEEADEGEAGRRISSTGTHQKRTREDLHKQANGPSLAIRRIKENRQQRPRRIRNHCRDIPRHKQQTSQKYAAGRDPNQHTPDHDLRTLHRRIRNLLNHMRHPIIPGQPQPSLQ